MKKYIFLGILLIIGGGIYYAATSYEGIVKNLVHKYGSEVTGTDVSLQGFKISLTEGEATINQIVVANPKGYSEPHFISLDGIKVKINLKSLTTDTIIIDSIVIDKPAISYEMLSLTQNNIKEIQNNVAKFSNTGKTAATPAVEKTENAEKQANSSKKVIIKELLINSGELKAATNIAGKASNIAVKLPDIKMTGIGQAKNGDSIPQIIAKVLNQILQTASKTVATTQIADLKGVASDNLNNVVGGVRDRVKTLGIFGK